MKLLFIALLLISCKSKPNEPETIYMHMQDYPPIVDTIPVKPRDFSSPEYFWPGTKPDCNYIIDQTQYQWWQNDSTKKYVLWRVNPKKFAIFFGYELSFTGWNVTEFSWAERAFQFTDTCLGKAYLSKYLEGKRKQDSASHAWNMQFEFKPIKQ